MKNKVGYNLKSGSIVKCIICGTERYISPSAMLNSGGKYCSKPCTAKGTKNGRYSKGVKRGPPSIATREKISLGNLGKTVSEEAKEKMRRAPGRPAGDKHYRYIKDRTLLKDDNKERWGQLHREWSQQVKKRDGWKCRTADNKCGGKLESHHILVWKEYPELRYSINNGITLCHAHHPRVRAEEKRLIPIFQELVLMSVSKV